MGDKSPAITGLLARSIFGLKGKCIRRTASNKLSDDGSGMSCCILGAVQITFVAGKSKFGNEFGYKRIGWVGQQPVYDVPLIAVKIRRILLIRMPGKKIDSIA